ncbi:MAG: hypothetical protein OEV38_04670 [Nitrospira sp.]|nr:hypothetical protein [Nitrospira sp.]MDH5320140.1 hypothetical protein [Nitrospira sp.]
MRNPVLILCVTVVLVIHQGCAHATGPILSESLQKNMQHIGVVVEEGQKQSMEDSRRGWLGSIGKGAARGSVLGGAGVICYIGAILCIPVLAAAGAVGGSIYGAFQAGLETLPNLLASTLAANAKTWGYPMDVIARTPIATEQTQPETGALQEPFDTLLILERPVVNLLPASYEFDPPRRVWLSVRLPLMRTSDQAVLDNRVVLEDLGEVHSVEEWTQDQARRFRDELPRPSRRLSEKILIDYFAKYEFDEREELFPLFGLGHSHGFYLRGLTSPFQIQPGPYPISILVDSLRPTLQWEYFLGNDVTYDLRLWESRESTSSRSGRPQLGEVAYEREGFTENSHTLETSLKPDTVYYWSVRVRFVKEGIIRVSEWTTYKIGVSTAMKVLTFGALALAESLSEVFDWTHYQIRTPPEFPPLSKVRLLTCLPERILVTLC